MDNCKKIKDLILTDYMDGQLDIAYKDQVESHLHQCMACQNFAEQIKTQLIIPFEKTTYQEVPEHLWQNIQERIQTEKYSKESLLDTIKGYVENISFPRLVPALGTFIMVFFLGSTFLLNQEVKQAQDQEQGSYLTYMLVAMGTAVPVGSNEQGTPIEKYFL